MGTTQMQEVSAVHGHHWRRQDRRLVASVDGIAAALGRLSPQEVVAAMDRLVELGVLHRVRDGIHELRLLAPPECTCGGSRVPGCCWEERDH